MSKDKRKEEPNSAWRTIHGAIWLIGLAILLTRGWIWPGILILIAFSSLLEVVLRQTVPQVFEEYPQTPPPATPSKPVAPVMEHRLELLPVSCPKCGAPVRGTEVKWTGPQSADCPYCGVNLPMRQPGA